MQKTLITTNCFGQIRSFSRLLEPKSAFLVLQENVIFSKRKTKTHQTLTRAACPLKIKKFVSEARSHTRIFVFLNDQTAPATLLQTDHST